VPNAPRHMACPGRVSRGAPAATSVGGMRIFGDRNPGREEREAALDADRPSAGADTEAGIGAEAAPSVVPGAADTDGAEVGSGVVPGAADGVGEAAADLVLDGDDGGAAAVAQTVRRLRDAADSRLTHPRRFRAGQLRAMERMLAEHEAELLEALAADLGRPAAEGRLGDIALVRSEIDHAQLYLSEWMEDKHVRVPLALQPASAKIEHRPLGLVLIMGPWNYPVLLLLAPLVGALAAGNCAVLKPSEHAPATSELLARIVPEHLDPRAVAVVQGGPEAGAALLAERWDHIVFTGGERAGRIVAEAAARNLTPVTLELGGKSPAVVADGNMAAVARRIAFGKFVNAGQTCTAPDYVLAVGPAYDALVEQLPKAIAAFYGKNPSKSRDLGRIVNREHYDRVAGYLEQGTVLAGGNTDPERLFIEPTVLVDVDPAAPVMREEIFGPVLPLLRVESTDEAVRFVNARPAPLAAYLFSEKPRLHSAFEDQIRAGAVGHNICNVHAAVPALPFGGIGASGMGAYHGKWGFDRFSQQRPVLSKTAMVDTLRAAYPPYSWAKRRVLRRLL
jgi:aldehyde dehydrogenase (NAD+)